VSAGSAGHKEGDHGNTTAEETGAGRAGQQPAESRRLLVALVGLVVLLGAGRGSSWPSGRPVTAAEFRGGARLAVDKDVIDFGTVKYNQRSMPASG